MAHTPTNANTTNAQVLQNMQNAAQMVAVAKEQAKVQAAAAQAHPRPQSSAAPKASAPAPSAKTESASSAAPTGKAEQSLYTSLAAEACGVGAVDDMMTLLTERMDPAHGALKHAQKMGVASSMAQTAEDFFFGPSKSGSKKAGSLFGHDDDPLGKIGLAGHSLTSQKDAKVSTWGVQPQGITQATKQAQQTMTLAMRSEKEFGFAQRELQSRQQLAYQAGMPGLGMGHVGAATRTDYLRVKEEKEKYGMPVSGFKSPELTMANGPKAPSEKMLSDTTTGAG